jgi:conjugal transfer/type IV secretion protein DotA/TraY
VPALSWNINQKISQPYVDLYTTYVDPPAGTEPTAELRVAMIKNFQERMKWIIDDSLKREQNNARSPYKMSANLLTRGWMAAGVWYNRIAEMNGAFTSAAWNLPKPTYYPETMMKVAIQKQQAGKSIQGDQVFNPAVKGAPINIAFSRGGSERGAAEAYWSITKWWQDQGTGFTAGTRGLQSGNPILDLINYVFGTSGLFSIRQNANVHPMAQLSSIGKALIERSITLLGVGVLGTFAQPWMTGQFAGLRQAVEVVSGFAFSFLSIGAAAGFIMYYVIPFLPFIYFFFAAAGWVKAIFEAMVGVPLWALAHIRIDGSGLPGDAAMGGYYMLLEIMIRPILIVIGLICSVSIYAASVQVLNDIFNVAVMNVTGVDMGADNSQLSLENIRGTIDVFFYTILYVILVYMIGMSSFKMIDVIPSAIGRWLGASISPYKDSGEGQASTLVGYGTVGSNIVFGQLSGAAQKGAAGISETMKSVGSMADKK